MESLVFTLQEGLSAREQDDVVQQVGALQGAHLAAPLSPTATSLAARRFCKVNVEDDSRLPGLMDEIRNLPGVLSVNAPAPRSLIQPVPSQPPK